MVHFSFDVRAHVYLQVQEMASVHDYLSDYSFRLLGERWPAFNLNTIHPCLDAWWHAMCGLSV